MAGYLYLAVSAGLGAGFVWLAWKVCRASEGDYASAKKLFGFSIIYLFALFAAVLIEAMAATYL